VKSERLPQCCQCHVSKVPNFPPLVSQGPPTPRSGGLIPSSGILTLDSFCCLNQSQSCSYSHSHNCRHSCSHHHHSHSHSHSHIHSYISATHIVCSISRFAGLLGVVARTVGLPLPITRVSLSVLENTVGADCTVGQLKIHKRGFAELGFSESVLQYVLGFRVGKGFEATRSSKQQAASGKQQAKSNSKQQPVHNHYRQHSDSQEKFTAKIYVQAIHRYRGSTCFRITPPSESGLQSHY